MTRFPISGALIALSVIFSSHSAMGAEFEFKLQSFLPAQAVIPKDIIDVWADGIEDASGGRIEISRYPSMQLGGKPPELLDQVADGIIDMTWTVVGYTPGRFPSTEVFELPFIVEDAVPASAAYWTMLEEDIAEREMSQFKVLGGWVHGPGVFHAKKAIASPTDLNGMKIRGASRQVNALLNTLGATPVGMPVPSVPEALSKGVIDGTTIPWEVTKALKIPELVSYHTEFTGPMLYTVTFVLVMNKEKFAALPEDLQNVVTENSGMRFSVFAGEVQQSADAPARQIAAENGNEILTLDAGQSAAFSEAAQPVYDTWLSEMSARGLDGEAMIKRARELMEQYKN